MYRRALLVVAFVALSGSLGSCSVCKKHEFWSLIKKLDFFAEGSSNEVPPFWLLTKAYEQFSRCPTDYKTELMAKNPRVALMNDFFFTPMKRFLRQEHLNEPEAEEAFAKRLALAYRRFRPIYLLDDDAPDTTYVRAPKTNALLDTLGETTGHQPLTVKMLVDAKREYETLKAKVKEIVTYEDVYAEEKNLALTMKYFVKGPIRALEDYIFPKVSKNMQLGHRQIKELRDLYKRGLTERNYVVQYGQLYKMARKYNGGRR